MHLWLQRLCRTSGLSELIQIHVLSCLSLGRIIKISPPRDIVRGSRYVSQGELFQLSSRSSFNSCFVPPSAMFEDTTNEAVYENAVDSFVLIRSHFYSGAFQTNRSAVDEHFAGNIVASKIVFFIVRTYWNIIFVLKIYWPSYVRLKLTGFPAIPQNYRMLCLLNSETRK